MIINRITKGWLEDSELKLITMEEGQFGTRKRKILKMMALKRKKLKRRYAGRGDHNERLPHLPKFLKKIFCKSCNDGTHKRCIRPGESLDNYKCQRCDHDQLTNVRF